MPAPEGAQGDVEQAADQEGEGHDHGDHGERDFRALFLDHHHQAGEAGNEQGDGDHADHGLDRRQRVAMANSPVAPKSRRRKPMTKAAEASLGRPSQPETSGSPASMMAGRAPACRART
jgi:hypothetical protein